MARSFCDVIGAHEFRTGLGKFPRSGACRRKVGRADHTLESLDNIKPILTPQDVEVFALELILGDAQSPYRFCRSSSA